MLRAVETIFLGIFLCPLFCFGQLQELEILESRGTRAHDLHPHTVMTLAYDQADSSERQFCYLSHRGSLEKGPPEAYFHIHEAVVDAVMILNRNDGYYWQENGMRISVCDSATEACQECGEIRNAQSGAWSTTLCTGKIGDVIYITHRDYFMALDVCEIKVKGQKMVVEEEPVVVQPEPVQSDPGLGLQQTNNSKGRKGGKSGDNFWTKVKKGAHKGGKAAKKAGKRAGRKLRNRAKNLFG